MSPSAANVFQEAAAPLVRARSVGGLTVSGNRLAGAVAGSAPEADCLVKTAGCADVVVKDNTWDATV
jgi:hypothetical protein